MSKLDDIFINWAATWAIISISATGQELPDIKERVKDLMLEVIGKNVTGASDELSVFAQDCINETLDGMRQKVNDL